MEKDNKHNNQEVKKTSKSTLIILGILVCILMVGIGFLLGGYIVGQNDDMKKTELIDNKQKEEKEEKEKEKILGEEEKRILAGEIVIYRLEDEKKSGDLCKLDLDLDGEKEQISIGKLEVKDESEKFDIIIDDNKVTFESFGIEHELVAFAMDTNKIILGAHANGMSDDFISFLYTYDGEKINNAGSLPNDISAANLDGENSVVVIGKGKLKCYSQEGTISNFVYRNFDWNGSKLVMKEEDVLQYTNPEEELILKKEIEVYRDYKDLEDDKETIKIKPGVVHPIKKGPENWNYIRSEDGAEGWFTFDIEKYFDIFANMNLAG